MRLPLPLLLLLASLSLPLHARTVQHPSLTQSPLSAQRAQEVKEAFVGAYADYKRYAWGHDEVAPVSRNHTDTRNGWGATIVDSLDTMILMNLTDLVDEAITYISTIDFTHSKTNSSVSVFESIIRYVGGLLSAYELTSAQHPVLLSQALSLGHKLAHAWTDGRSSPGVGPDGEEMEERRNMPYTWLDFETDKPALQIIGLATAGTSLLEFSKLSKYTGNTTFLDLSERSMRAVFGTPQYYPGLFGEMYDPRTDGVVRDKVSMGANCDSFYEYLLKWAQMTGNADPTYLDLWLAGVDSTIRTMLFKSTVGGWTWLSNWTNHTGKHDFQFSHLACYVGGNWLLGAQLTSNSTIYAHGLALAESCAHTYASSPLGIGPELWAYVPEGVDTKAMGGEDFKVPQNGTWIEGMYNARGYWTEDHKFILRPEVVESMFYAYRITGDPIWQDRVYAAFKAVMTHCKAPASYASLIDMESTTPKLKDESESFFYAELMKYFYLTFADPDLVNLDRYTITTEAHPFLLETTDFDYTPPEADDADVVADEPEVVVDEPEAVAEDECGTAGGGRPMSYLMMLMDFYVPVLERCAW